MQIGGSSRQGILIGEYGGGRFEGLGELLSVEEALQRGASEVIPDTNPVIGYIQPACKHPQWIMWFMQNGDAVLYTEREPNGGVIGDPIRIKAQGNPKDFLGFGKFGIKD